MEAIDKEFNMTSSSLAVRVQDKDVQPLVIQDPLVQKFQKTMKQYPPGSMMHAPHTSTPSVSICPLRHRTMRSYPSGSLIS